MAWSVAITERAERDLASMPLRDREAVRQATLPLTDGLGGANVRKLSGRGNQWRLRVGRWRAILEVDTRARRIVVARVLPRDRAYRD